ncbi:TIGR03668 family PPOX class F420-dependent oxidoreductase [Mycobacterium persicum]|uniref:PPOX class F420-dependent oxidoreductase n=1 Tax=Mycobacterium persicum TaxID=1487726 RepID=A0A1X0L9U4_9MYCO|nr:TIGR03668 family PPOX class F420-dependent oxidoreductase [Mycobacterium persicum]KZS83160.1 PPOX class F420-dependent enzyme [Mycobacterium persicum]ORB46603.1 PPOX class F420-dependent oxidoreductase [Mycobacterium persicum]ORB90349.1 PPOX class F420-dependent oxidoreductase [Mycobacterium persicum]ORB95765.1 PPOX class F420-dependent oxidoreductase [Mycobacterium persicum]ORC01439.1 PPOX class F420-dependent oxidoreductase [Mycobacterium persicum]
MGEFDPKAAFSQSPVARLATITPAGTPHLVPVVFAVDRDRIFTAVDAKPKTTRRLQRLTNINSNPHVSLLVDHYDDDWTQLWWARADGVAAIYHDGAAMHTGYRLLRTKYPQYQSIPLDGPVVTVSVRRWSGWHS